MRTLCTIHNPCQRLSHNERMHNAFMYAHERLKKARIEAGYKTARAASSALGLPEQTYMPWESGRTGFSRQAARLAHFFGVNLLWLRGETRAVKTAPKNTV